MKTSENKSDIMRRLREKGSEAEEGSSKAQEEAVRLRRR